MSNGTATADSGVTRAGAWQLITADSIEFIFVAAATKTSDPQVKIAARTASMPIGQDFHLGQVDMPTPGALLTCISVIPCHEEGTKT